jgi:hypothetical protein
MKLDESQIRSFQAFGFLKLPGLLSADEVKLCAEEIDLSMSAPRPDKDAGPQDGKVDPKVKGGGLNDFAMLSDGRSPFTASLLDDDRFATVAEQLMGKPVLGISTNGRIWRGDTEWHPDVQSLGYGGLRFAIYLDDLTASNGALRFVPGSHVDPLFSQMSYDVAGTFGTTGVDLPSYVCEVKTGDVVVFNLAIWHAAFNGTARRQAQLVYYEDPGTSELEAQARTQFEAADRRMKEFGLPGWFSEAWQSVPDERHQRWVSRVRQLGLVP